MKSEQDSSRYQNSERFKPDTSKMDEATINDILGSMGMQEASPDSKSSP